MAKSVSPETSGDLRLLLAEIMVALDKGRISARGAMNVNSLCRDVTRLMNMQTRYLVRHGSEPILSGSVPRVSDLVLLVRKGDSDGVVAKARKKRERMAVIIAEVRARLDGSRGDHVK